LVRELAYVLKCSFYKNDQNTDGSHSPKYRSVTVFCCVCVFVTEWIVCNVGFI